MTYQEFLELGSSTALKFLEILKFVYIQMLNNYFFKTIIFMLIFSFALWLLFWLKDYLILNINHKWYSELYDRERNEYASKINTPPWFNTEIQRNKPNKKEQKEMDNLLNEFK